MQRLNNNINIFVVTHKVFAFPQAIDGQIYTPIQVGTGANLGYLQENQLDNIAHKNANYCELSALYFLWKNVRCNIAGLAHYRRYLCSRQNSSEFIGKQEIESLLNQYDLLLPKKRSLSYPLAESYAIEHHACDWYITRQVIADIQPDYLAAFDQVAKQSSLYYANMLIARKPLFDEYCQWLFAVLFEVEKRVDIREYDKYQSRIFGFLSERLLNVWLAKHANRLRLCELPVWDGKQNDEMPKHIFVAPQGVGIVRN